ncbi:serine/threonine-protein kinase C-like [Palaemon carinicauda]|uniref:serine/threonine-protein kinase C-like n=1 Tax=Palaemon carinicauda TaxID=392227 RepID=UPI0035B69A8C
MSVFYLGDWAWHLYPEDERHCRKRYKDRPVTATAVKPINTSREQDLPIPNEGRAHSASPDTPTPQPSHSITPTTETTPQPSHVPSTPLQPVAEKALSPTLAPETSTAMETEPAETLSVPQGDHSLDFNCIACLTQLLKEATAIATQHSST